MHLIEQAAMPLMHAHASTGTLTLQSDPTLARAVSCSFFAQRVRDALKPSVVRSRRGVVSTAAAQCPPRQNSPPRAMSGPSTNSEFPLHFSQFKFVDPFSCRGHLLHHQNGLVCSVCWLGMQFGNASWSRGRGYAQGHVCCVSCQVPCICVCHQWCCTDHAMAPLSPPWLSH